MLAAGPKSKKATSCQINNAFSHLVLKLCNDETVNVVLNNVTSSFIGELVMTHLKKLDKVAFVRFASVYMNFEATEDFEKFIQKGTCT